MITEDIKVTEHFDSKSFRCSHCKDLLISEDLINRLEELGKVLNFSKAKVISGYRCKSNPVELRKWNTGQHTLGKAADVIYYDIDCNEIPSKIVICMAYDTGLFKGMANISSWDKGDTHLDIRDSGKYMGDELIDYKSHYTNPYKYYNVKEEDMAKYKVSIKDVDKDDSKDQVLVKVNMLYIRKEASTSSMKLGTVKKGCYYNYYDIVENEGYTWYKIGDNMFIANNGNYLEVFSVNSQDKLIEELNNKIKELESELNSYKFKYVCKKSGKYLKSLSEGDILIIK